MKIWKKKKTIFLVSPFQASFVTTADEWNLQALPSCQYSRRNKDNIQATLATNQTTGKDGKPIREKPHQPIDQLMHWPSCKFLVGRLLRAGLTVLSQET